MHAPTLPYVNPRIRRDAKSHQTCEFNAMLKALLKQCLRDNSEPDLDQVLKRCLDAVIPLCNDDHDLRSYLYDYCKTISTERDRYAPFVRLCNHALDVLGSKKKPLPLQRLSPLSSDQILFHVSDSSVINCPHGERKPDVLLVPLEPVQQSAKDEHRHDSWKDDIMKTATSPPHKAFSWEDIILPLEFKTAKRKLNSPPETYEIMEPKYVKPKPTPSSGLSDSWFSTSSSTSGLTTGSMSRQGASMEEATTSASKQSAVSKGALSRASSKQKESGDRGSDSKIEPTRQSTRLQERPSASNSQYSAGSGTKRASESGTTESSAKRQRIEKPTTLHVNVQTAVYGSEILSHSPFSASAMAMVIVDSVVYLWWYDRQGAIQTHGLDFIEDLPHFLVLLIALQRLPKGWNKILTTKSQIRLEGQYGGMDIKLGERLVTHWGIQGRATNILEVKALSLLSLIPSGLKERLETQGMVAKLLWAQSKRVRESKILQEIPKRIKDLSEEDREAVEGHIPDMIASTSFPDCETRIIRNDLGIPVKDIENRVLIMSVFRKLRPITELEGDEFWRAFWDCVLCHGVLWKIGIRHRDISTANLMYYRYKGQVMGVLNDYDLSTLVGPDNDDGPSGTDRTGTLPYMALELLEPAALAGHVEHKYHHDFEAFTWVLTWVAHRYQGGKEIPNPPFNIWKTDHEKCLLQKWAFRDKLITDQLEHRPTDSHASVWQSCGTVFMQTAVFILFKKEKLDTVDEYLGRMKKSIEGSGKDLSVNSFSKLSLRSPSPFQIE